ncbi:cysteinyl-tRNA synthetase [Breznakia sp. PF5-3]|uniref:cysteine--tRNA ligase n=1 Tax=unclassified Breznakia TaxID=2623764 RepID=UPI0024065463|nr:MULTISPECIES: cysteine--tRNA ligase [unclassified Breznakia]MDL2276553.1 cysteine--tRNA ligase [Breznakia sp. OttesenSCG-928-G09]MDF9825542.1 cysteinyl-tRNA synthetase [Breznakia sp. PM6-1]MDF9836414.1 cysteinyl-tRNA synthetase [Breznakia sp. PF5-3]MDF9838196.1 cysteinyl-tRNA synthetase [Breznakia sp. PFB2-8]MDF9860211.1 cysteinyl-tRNA synthetase [Breznakia sp. PH5-24]
MKLFNSLSNTLEEFVPIHPGEVSMYVCGPTVYNYPHIGNTRPIVVFDTLKKTLEASGYKVRYVSNFTDVDDKIIKKAVDEKVSELVISNRYIDAYNEDRLSLNADLPDATPRVTNSMDEIIAFIKDLETKGYAYAIDGDVYFRVSKVKDYGQLSKQKIEDLMVGARIDENDRKENPLDFTLWKKTEAGIKWDSPWGQGRPGWHTECVVMIEKEFHQQMIDIHGGGMDLKFPHHENEIAQGCAANHSHVAKYWVHNGMLNIDGSKMSKSLGNVIWAKDFIYELGGNTVRWLMLSTHYRSPLNINEETIQNAKTELEKFQTSLRQAYVKLALKNQNIVEEIVDDIYQPFLVAMQDDLNTSNAFKALFDANKKLNASLRQREIAFEEVGKTVYTIEKMLSILGILLPRVEVSKKDRDEFDKWEQAKRDKDFALADELRNNLQSRGLL